MTNEEIRDKVARHFGLGEYGVRLAQEYLDEYAHNLAEEIRSHDNQAGYDLYSMGIDHSADLIDPWA